MRKPPRIGDTPIRRANGPPMKPRKALFHSKINNQHSSIVNLPFFVPTSSPFKSARARREALQSCVLCLEVFCLFPTSETQAAQNMKLLYVGMTRAKERLLITASGRNEFTEKLGSMTGPIFAVA